MFSERQNKQIQLNKLKTPENNIRNMYIDNQTNYIKEKSMKIQRET